jgi:hypothetical protein
MGRASSKKKDRARVARAAGRRASRRNLGWPLMMGGLVILGVVLILITLSGDDAEAVDPRPGDHWHAAYGINNCGAFLGPLNDVTQDVTGIHTHGDGLMHIHPFSSQYAGEEANLGTFGQTVGLQLTDTSFKAGTVAVKNGDDCNGQPGKVQLKVWDSLDDDEGRLLESDFAEFNPQDGELVTIAFLPEGADIPKPPDYALTALPAPSDVTGVPVTTTTTAPAPTSTSAPAG